LIDFDIDVRLLRGWMHRSMGGWFDRYVAGSVVASIITRRNKKNNNKEDFGLVQGSRGNAKPSQRKQCLLDLH